MGDPLFRLSLSQRVLVVLVEARGKKLSGAEIHELLGSPQTDADNLKTVIAAAVSLADNGAVRLALPDAERPECTYCWNHGGAAEAAGG
ncbi:MAG TPA: hypothetical protein VGG48_14100 [Rhizomicrobium sp.]|jgi:hypothetical protein